MNNSCPCLSGKTYQECCAPLHLGHAVANSAQQLMQSRYCAFVKNDDEYIFITHSPKTRNNISIADIKKWNAQCQWLGLEIRSTSTCNTFVEFVAWYKHNNKLNFHHEISQFEQQVIDTELSHRLDTITEKKAWYYLEAQYPKNLVKMPQRNDICICGSNKKYKKCCA